MHIDMTLKLIALQLQKIIDIIVNVENLWIYLEALFTNFVNENLIRG